MSEPDDTPAKPPRKRGYRFSKIKRDPGDELKRRGFWLLDSEMDFLEQFGGPKREASAGLRAIIKLVRDFEGMRNR